MMRFAAVLVVMAGCAPIDGYPCETEAATQCEGSRVAYCERASSGGLKWKAYDCPSGCDPLKASEKCDWKGAVPGAACPAGATTGLCAADARDIICLASPNGRVWQDVECAMCRAGQRPEDVLRCSGGLCFCN